MPSVYEGNILTVNQASESSTVHSLLLQPAKKKKKKLKTFERSCINNEE